MTAPDATPRRALDWAGRLALVGLGAAVLAAAAHRLGDFDLPWHLALGRAAVAHRALPFADDFSFTLRGRRAPDEFLADTILYVCARAGGAVGLQLLALGCVALLGWLLVRRAQPAPRPIALAFAALGLVAAGPWLVVRPALFSFPALAGMLAVIDRHRRTRRGLGWLVPLQLVWSNLHGFAALGAPLALGYAGYVALCRLARGRAGRLLPADEGGDVGLVAGVALATLAASLASPFGAALYSNAVEVGGLHALVTEWAPTTPGFLFRFELPLLLLALLALAGLAAARAAAFDLGLALLAFALAGSAVRLVPLAAIVLAPLAARTLAPQLLRARGAPLLVAVMGLLAAPALVAAPGLRAGVGWDTANLPEGAVRFVAAARPTGAPWNFLPFGGWMTWRLYPETRVFIDGRTARLYPIPFVARYARAEHDPAAFAALAAQYDLQWAVVRARPGERFSEPIARDRRWVMVYLDDCAAVYVRADGPNRALAARGYTLLRHLTRPPEGPVAPALLPALRHDAALALAQDPSSLRARALAAAAGL